MKLVKKHPKTGLWGVGLFEFAFWTHDFSWADCTGYGLRIGFARGERKLLHLGLQTPKKDYELNLWWGYSKAQEREWTEEQL